MDRSFRLDINGLRALAVLGVVAYHFDLGVLRGGFVGVDVFFVVSGFLMTRIIAGRLEADRFSLLGFYNARARRIVPALAVLVLVVGAAGALVLNPLRLDILSKDCLSSLLFVSNVLYLHQGGYFAAAANQNWLLHTWSLSLEWQFYLLFPLLLAVLVRFGLRRRGICAVLLVLAALSFGETVAAHVTGGTAQDEAFYLLPARAWEFIVGSFCAYAPASLLGRGARARRALHLGGIAMILVAMARLDAVRGWPSALALLPVAGAAAVLLAECQDAAWSRLGPVRRIGTWSYSIYLWHWPIAAWLSSAGVWSLEMRLLGIAVSVGLAALSYEFVEQRATVFLWARPRRVLTLGAPALALPLALALATNLSNGLETLRYARQPEVRAQLADYRAAIADWRFPKSCGRTTFDATGFSTCTFGDPKARDVLVVGDSFAEQLTPRYTNAKLGAGHGITFVTRGGCPLLPGVDRHTAGANCGRWTAAAYDYAERNDFKRIVFIGAWLTYSPDTLCFLDKKDCGSALDDAATGAALDAGFARMAARWRRLERQGKEVVVFDTMPFGDGDPAALYQKAVDGHPVDTLRLSLQDFNAYKMQIIADRVTRAARSAAVTLVDPTAFLCAEGSCPIVEAGRTLYKDEAHFRASIVGDKRFDFLDRYLMLNDGVRQEASRQSP